MKKTTKIIAVIGAISAGILGVLGYTTMLVFNSTAYGPPQSKLEWEMLASALQRFNSQFLAYIGENRTAAQIKSLTHIVAASNAADSGHQVIIKYKENDTASEVDMTESIIEGFDSKDRFTISIDDKNNDGYYDTIIVTKQN